jgi:translation initiation factor IF-1
MLFGETVAVYCENHKEHINTLCGHFSSYLTGNTLHLRYKSQPVNAVYCENHTEHINTLCGHFSLYLTGNTLRLRYKLQLVNAVSGYSRCLL